jgi:hypothetical protein
MIDCSKKSPQIVLLKTRILAEKIIENHRDLHVHAFRVNNAIGEVQIKDRFKEE